MKLLSIGGDEPVAVVDCTPEELRAIAHLLGSDVQIEPAFMPHPNGYDALIFGADGQDSEFRPALLRAFDCAADDGMTRCSIEIRSHAHGTSEPRQEAKYHVDLNAGRIDDIMHDVVRRLTESPGEGFEGQIRVNFTASGGVVRYGSFTRRIGRPPARNEGQPVRHRLSPNVIAALTAWDRPAWSMGNAPLWALERASEITKATVPQVDPTDSRNMLYEMPAGLKLRLTYEIAVALVEERRRATESEGA